MSVADLPTGGIAIVDTNVLFAMGGPSNEKYQALESYVTRRNVAVRIPDHVARELGEAPDAYRYQRDRLRAVQDAGWLESGTRLHRPRRLRRIDRTRERIFTLSDDDVSQDDVEMTDAVLAGLAYQYASDRSNRVTVPVSDGLAERAIEDVLIAKDGGQETTVLEGRSFPQKLLEKQL